jgi:hypothetical protein
MNEAGHCDQLKIKEESITPMHWNAQPYLSADGKLINWGNGTVWTR